MATRDDLLSIGLTDAERRVLAHGLIEWGGPARCTEAMGFSGRDGLREQGRELARALRERLPHRGLAQGHARIEVAFVSDVVGAGLDWRHVAGMSDEGTLTHIRAIQR